MAMRLSRWVAAWSVSVLALALCPLVLAAERATPIAGDFGNDARFGTMYVSAPDGVVAAEQGHLPIVDHAGKRALEVSILKNADKWTFGLSRAWSRFYLADYLPDGTLDVTVCGDAGGEVFEIGIGQDANRYRKTQLHAPMVQIGKYGTVSKQWQTLRIPLRDIVAADKDIDLDDCIKVVVGNSGPAKPQKFYLADVRFTTTSPETVYLPIKVDQLGYRPGKEKIAKISVPVTAFRVVDTGSGKTMFSGQARPFVNADVASGDDIWEADFSSVNTPGKYRIEADGVAPSDVFEIREDIYNRLFVDAMRYYFLQRCNMTLDEKHAGAHARKACHPLDTRATSEDGKDVRNVTGGWHDAGDSDKYPPNLSIAVSMPLAVFELRPDAVKDVQFNIPESGNGIPDILNELQYELDWLLKMQITEGPQAGAVYDRTEGSPVQPPEAGNPPLYDFRILRRPTDGSTGITCANLAYASRVMAQVPACKEKAQRYMHGAELAWKRLEADKVQGDALLAAALGMFDATGDARYATVINRELDRALPADMPAMTKADRVEWAIYTTFLCNLANSKQDALGVRERARGIVKQVADFVTSVSLKDGYGSPIWEMNHYCWGSTSNIGKFGYICLMANRFAPNADYVRTGENALHYHLGRNALARTFVSLYGTRWAEIFSGVYGDSNDPVVPGLPPGFVPGGVNMQSTRGTSAWPAKHYKPDPNNWTISEDAVYYNAPLVFLAGYFAELK